MSSGPRPVAVIPASGHLVPVTMWVHPGLHIPTHPGRVPGRYGRGTRSPWELGGLAVMAAVAATAAACLVIALLALVAWVSAHAVAVGTGLAAVVATALLVLRALARARNTGPGEGCHRCGA